MSSNIENERAIAIASSATEYLFREMTRAANAAAIAAISVHGDDEYYDDCIDAAARAAAKAIANNASETVAAAHGAYAAAYAMKEIDQDVEYAAYTEYATAVAEASDDPEYKHIATAIAHATFSEWRSFVDMKMASGFADINISIHPAVAAAAASVTNIKAKLIASATILADATAAYHAAKAAFAAKFA